MGWRDLEAIKTDLMLRKGAEINNVRGRRKSPPRLVVHNNHLTQGGLYYEKAT